MNNVQLVGRLVRDIDCQIRGNNLMVGRFTIAVNRRTKSEADFISCVAFGRTAEVLRDYTHKGSRIGIVGRIQTGSYKANDGKTVYTTDVVCETAELLDSKGASAPTQAAPKAEGKPQYDIPPNLPDGFYEYDDGDQIPF